MITGITTILLILLMLFIIMHSTLKVIKTNPLDVLLIWLGVSMVGSFGYLTIPAIDMLPFVLYAGTATCIIVLAVVEKITEKN
jgi:hypothetical protein